MRLKVQSRPAPAVATKPPAEAPAWLRPAIVVLAVLMLLSWFSGEVGDSDTWWHLKTGQYIVQQHRLPVPDPFGYTTYTGADAYKGESVTRYFNLTHEWLAQVIMYGAYSGGGYAGIVLLRACMLSLFAFLVGLLVYRRTGNLHRAVAAGIAVAVVSRIFAGDRPQYITYVLLLITVNLLDSRRYLWLLPPLFLFWANCHAGFFLGWVMIGIYCAESLYLRWRGKPLAEERTLWLAGASAVLISGLNPNGFHIVEVMRNYRTSPMQARIWEWQYPKFWEVTPFTVILYGAVLVLLLNYRKVRPVDWLLLAVFSASGLLALRNIIFTGFAGALVIAAYLPQWKEKLGAREWLQVGALAIGSLFALKGQLLLGFGGIGVALLLWRGILKVPAEFALALLLAAGAGTAIAGGGAFQFRAAAGVPADACDFLLQHHIQGRLFNTYGQGGYLIWRLWPQLKVFIDGRALNEKIFKDAERIGMNAEETGGKSGEALLKEYGIDIIMMDGFDAVSGTANYLPAALADPKQTEWKLVFRDVHDVIYMRNPPPDVRVLDSFDALAGMEEQCQYLVDHGAPTCTLGMLDVFSRVGDRGRHMKWMNIYRQSHVEQVYTRF
jgi:hypothetical protein